MIEFLVRQLPAYLPLRLLRIPVAGEEEVLVFVLVQMVQHQVVEKLVELTKLHLPMWVETVEMVEIMLKQKVVEVEMVELEAKVEKMPLEVEVENVEMEVVAKLERDTYSIKKRNTNQ